MSTSVLLKIPGAGFEFARGDGYGHLGTASRDFVQIIRGYSFLITHSDTSLTEGNSIWLPFSITENSVTPFLKTRVVALSEGVVEFSLHEDITFTADANNELESVNLNRLSDVESVVQFYEGITPSDTGDLLYKTYFGADFGPSGKDRPITNVSVGLGWLLDPEKDYALQVKNPSGGATVDKLSVEVLWDELLDD